MVSTRQMATSNSGSNNSHSAGGSGANHNLLADETARLSVVTRQSSSNFMPVPSAETPSSSTVATSLLSIAAPNTAAVTTVATMSSATRHSLLTQAVKTNGSVTAPFGPTDAMRASSSSAMVVAADNGAAADWKSDMHLHQLPVEILSKILSYMDYKRIGQLRVVSQKVNDVCMLILNSTFAKLITQTYNHFHSIKANMPRRESARRNHPLACECDIIETCYMRLSLLQMTIGKHIERGHCCFFPGAILDEVYIILNYIKNTPCLERPYRVTDELFDLSTMAMEYFRDRIEPTLPGIAYFNKEFFKLPATKRPALVVASDLTDSSSSLPSPPQSNMVLRKGIRKIKEGMKIYNNQLSVLRAELRTCKRKSSEQGKQIAEQQKLLAEQQKQTLEYATRLDENDKKNEEMARKFSTLLQELNKCKTELQYWRSKSPAIPACTSCGQKVVPVLPPEDYQALINQGVKPEDIILNLSDDTDAESDVSSNESNLLLTGNGFAFPDETTTAKLLAVNTAAKNLKRQHQSHNPNGTASNLHTSTSNKDTRNSGLVAEAAGLAAVEPPVIIDCLVDANCTTVASTGASTAPVAAIKTLDTTTTTTQPHTHGKDLNASCDAATKGVVAATAAGLANVTICAAEGIAVGYSAELFYGTAHNAQKSVIVSPSMLAAVDSREDVAVLALPMVGDDDPVKTGDNTMPACAGVGPIATATAATAPIEDVVALQAIKSHETKKARRVQKATRCGTNAAGGSKRGK